MDELCFLSVIVPVYNVEKYLKECVESLLKQSFQSMEIILVDDGSTDDSGKICDTFAGEHSHIRVLHKENGGLVSARKAGLALAQGRYIGYVDSDDKVAENFFERLCSAAEEEDADIVAAGMQKWEGETLYSIEQDIEAGTYDKNLLLQKVYPRMLFSGHFFRFGLIPSVVNKIFKRELAVKYQNMVPDEVSLGEDAACTYPSLLGAEKMVCVDTAGYFYRSNPASITTGFKARELDGIISLTDYLYRCFGEKLGGNGETQVLYYSIYLFDTYMRKLLLHNAGFPYKKMRETIKRIQSCGCGKGIMERELPERTSSRAKRLVKLLKEPKMKNYLELKLFVSYESIKDRK